LPDKKLSQKRQLWTRGTSFVISSLVCHPSFFYGVCGADVKKDRESVKILQYMWYITKASIFIV
jgi:hypothetical protein